MGQNISSEPVVEKETERDQNETYSVAVSSCQGWRMSQEDNHSLILELPGPHKASFFAVFDGHGSARVSKHASEALHRHLVENEFYIKGDFPAALENAFLTFDREVSESYNAQMAGTTAVCVLIVDNIVYCANIGDSRAVACVNCKLVPLSEDHKPDKREELLRILAAGGYVFSNRVNGSLALSRAFGDFHYKQNMQLPPEKQMVSPFPEILTEELNDSLDFIVLACDGIWDVLTSREVVEFVLTRIQNEMEPGLICEQLTTRCLATDYELVIGCDNMTVLLVCYLRGRSWSEYCADVAKKYQERPPTPFSNPQESQDYMNFEPNNFQPRQNASQSTFELMNALEIGSSIAEPLSAMLNRLEMPTTGANGSTTCAGGPTTCVDESSLKHDTEPETSTECQQSSSDGQNNGDTPIPEQSPANDNTPQTCRSNLPMNKEENVDEEQLDEENSKCEPNQEQDPSGPQEQAISTQDLDETETHCKVNDEIEKNEEVAPPDMCLAVPSDHNNEEGEKVANDDDNCLQEEQDYEDDLPEESNEESQE